MQVCILFRQEGRDEEVQREQTAQSFMGFHLFLEVRICNALLCSTKVFGLKSLCVRQGKCSLTANERFVWFTLEGYLSQQQIWHNLIQIKIKRQQVALGVKAQFHIHLFKNKDLNCLKLKWALNLTCVMRKCTNKFKRYLKRFLQKNGYRSHQCPCHIGYYCSSSNVTLLCNVKFLIHTFSFHNVRWAPLVSGKDWNKWLLWHWHCFLFNKCLNKTCRNI